jgi:hypothetical protein
LEELTKSDSIFLNLNLDLEKEIINVVRSLEVLSLTEICLLPSCCFCSKSTLSSVGVSSIDEFQVLYVIGLIAIGLYK